MEIFRSYNSDDPQVVKSGANASTNTPKSGNAHTVSTKPTKAKAYEESYEEVAEPEYPHLSQSHPPPPTTLPSQERKGLRYFLELLKNIFKRKSKR